MGILKRLSPRKASEETTYENGEVAEVENGSHSDDDHIDDVDETSMMEEGGGDEGKRSGGFFNRFRKNKEEEKEQSGEEQEEEEEEEENDQGEVSLEEDDNGEEEDVSAPRGGFFGRFRKKKEENNVEDEIPAVDTASTENEDDDEQSGNNNSMESGNEEDGQEFGLKDYEKIKTKDEKIAKQEDPEYQAEQSKKNKMIAIGLALLVLLALIIGLAVGLGKRNKNDAATMPDEEDAIQGADDGTTSILYNDLVDLLTPYTDEDILLDPSTTQFQAFSQLHEEATADNSILIMNGELNGLRVRQRYALMMLYASTTAPDDNWDKSYGWITNGLNECNWYGVGTCRRTEDGTLAVTNIQLASNGLSGEIPSEICALSDEMTEIDMSDNNLTGKLPTCMGETFVNLENLMMQSNNFDNDQVIANESGLCTLIESDTLNAIAFDCYVECECCGNIADCGDGQFYYLHDNTTPAE